MWAALGSTFTRAGVFLPLSWLVFVGCGFGSKSAEIVAPTEGVAVARAFLGAVRDSEPAVSLALLDPAIQDSNASVALLEVGSGLQDFPSIDSAKLVGFAVNHNATNRGVDTVEGYTFQLTDARNAALLEVALRVNGGGRTVAGFHGRDLPEPLEQLTSFRLTNLASSRGVVLALGVLGFLSSVIGAIYAYRHAAKRKWLWVLLAVSGCGQYSVNWASGEASLGLIRWQLLSAGAVRGGPYSPWIITAALPLGALAAWWLLRRRQANLESAPAT